MLNLWTLTRPKSRVLNLWSTIIICLKCQRPRQCCDFCKPNHNDVTIIHLFRSHPLFVGENEPERQLSWLIDIRLASWRCNDRLKLFYIVVAPLRIQTIFIRSAMKSYPNKNEPKGTATIQKVRSDFPSEFQNLMPDQYLNRLSLMFFLLNFFKSLHSVPDGLAKPFGWKEYPTARRDGAHTSYLSFDDRQTGNRKTGGYNKNIWALFHETIKSTSSQTSHWSTCLIYMHAFQLVVGGLVLTTFTRNAAQFTSEERCLSQIHWNCYRYS